MTEAQLAATEERWTEHLGPRLVDIDRDVPALCAEVRACWAAIHDMKEDSTAYRRAIVDAVLLLRRRMLCHDSVSEMTESLYAAADVALLAGLTAAEFSALWESV